MRWQRGYSAGWQVTPLYGGRLENAAELLFFDHVFYRIVDDIAEGVYVGKNVVFSGVAKAVGHIGDYCACIEFGEKPDAGFAEGSVAQDKPNVLFEGGR